MARIIVLLLVLLLGVSACGEQKLTEMKRKAPAPAYDLAGIDGERHTLESLKGKPVILNFWATWCPPCRDEIPSMNRAWEKVQNEGIEMIAIDVGEDPNTVARFLDNQPIDFPVLLGESGNGISGWPIRGLPTTYVIDAEGRVVYHAVGARNWADDVLLDKVRALR